MLAVAGVACVAAAAPVVPQYGVFETSLTLDAVLDNPFRDATASAVFTAPSGARVKVDGFHYGGNEWRVRFVPQERGAWQYDAMLEAAGRTNVARGSFLCEGVQGHGPLRLSSRNRFRMEYADGTPFYPVGIQTCNFLRPDFDGPNADGSWRAVSNEEWVAAFTGAVNLVRTQFGQGTTAGCALPLLPVNGPADRYDTNLAARIDEVYRLQRQHGLAQILILFQDMSLWGTGEGSSNAFGRARNLASYKSVHAANLKLQEQYLRYVVARYGCFVDIWEIFNEDSYAPDDYLAHLAAVIRAADPYRHILTTNYARPDAPWCEVVTWHDYMGMPAAEVDLYVAQQIGMFKSHGKVVQNTEFGNQGHLSNDDPVKWRIATWTAFLHESGMLYWGMSGRKVPAGNPKPKGNANAYIGPDVRQSFRVLDAFVRDLPLEMRPVAIGYHEQTDIRTYALAGGGRGVIYIHHFADHTKPFTLSYKLQVQVGPGRYRLRWIDPADGRELLTEELQTVQQYLPFRHPPVTIDVACRIERLGDAVP
jgi:hypothetical protein